MNDSRRTLSVGLALAGGLALLVGAGSISAQEAALKLRATAIGAGAPGVPWTIELSRWSTEAERAPLVAAFSAPPPAPPAVPASGGRGGRAGRGAAPPPSPLARLSSAVKGSPTLGFVWGDGVTGYSIKYAWRASTPEGTERIVLVTERRLGAHTPDWAPASSTRTEAEFTLVEMQINAKGEGEGKTSISSTIAVDVAAGTLALAGYPAAPVMLKVNR
ncbi:MAG TPA: hypothetical protein VIY56_18480 [Vicinamibacterales bacterium]